jgi:hypothetical protein
MFIFVAKTDDFLDKIFVQKKKRKREKTQDIGGNACFWYILNFYLFFEGESKKMNNCRPVTLFCYFQPQTFLKTNFAGLSTNND